MGRVGVLLGVCDMRKLLATSCLVAAMVSTAHADIQIPSFSTLSDYSLVCESEGGLNRQRVWFDVKPKDMTVHMTNEKGEEFTFLVFGSPMMTLKTMRNEFGHSDLYPVPVQVQFMAGTKIRALTLMGNWIYYIPITESGWIYKCL